MSSFCSKCGAKTNETAKFCAACGNKLSLLSSGAGLNSILSKGSDQTLSANHSLRSDKQNSHVRALFVIGSNTSRESEDWLKLRFPASKIIRFSTIGAIREASRRMFSAGLIDSLCLMGTAKTVPTGVLHEDGESYSFQPDAPFWSVESDLLYVESDILIHELPSTASNDPSGFLRRINSHVVEGGLLPLGRIPSDDLAFWQSYFESLENFTPTQIACVAISNFPQNWIEETKATLTDGRNSGCISQSLFTLGALDDDESDYEILNESPEQFADGSRIIVNLHGGLPSDYEPTQDLTTDDPDYSFRMTSFESFPRAILYLFSCYGGNSGWWRNGGVIPHFLSSGGVAAVASSSVSFVSDLDDDASIVRGSALMCSEFFKNIDGGLTFGEALKLAKMKTFMAATRDLMDGEHPALFCMAIKEIFQYSLFGAPWGVVSQNPPSNAPESLPKASILDKVRTGNLNSTLSSARAGLSELNSLRSQLNKTLGNNGIKYFSQTSNYVISGLKKNGTLNELTSELNSMGLDIDDASFESLVWEDRRYNLVALRDQQKPNQVGALVVLDENGKLLAKMQAKG